MKKIVILFMCLCMIMGLVYARGGQSQGAVTPGSASSAGPFGKYSPGITYSLGRAPATGAVFYPDDPDMRSLEENIWVRSFQEYLGINLEYKWVSPDNDSFITRFSAAIASGDLPDFAFVGANTYMELCNAGYTADMTQIYADYASPELKEITPKELLTWMSQDGKMYGFPISRGDGHYMHQLHIRKDWLDKVGLGIPTTFEEVVNAARAFQRANLGGDDTIGIALSRSDGAGSYIGIMNSFGAYNNIWVDVNGSLVYSQTLPEWRDGLLMLQSLYREGIINRDFAAITTTREVMANETAGITYAGSWDIPYAVDSLSQSNPDANIISLLVPSVSGKAIKYQTSTVAPGLVFVSANSRYPEAAVKIANLCLKLSIEDFEKYCGAPPTGGFRHRFMPWNDYIRAPYTDPLISNAIVSAEKNNGVLSQEALNTLLSVESVYNNYKLSLAGLNVARLAHHYYNEGGTYWNIYDALQRNLIIDDAFKTLPTETMVQMGNVIYDEINAAIFDVIMGADISNFDRAVERWRTNAGNRITQEVNAWYRSTR